MMNYQERNLTLAKAYGLRALIDQMRQRAEKNKHSPGWLIEGLRDARSRSDKLIPALIEFRGMPDMGDTVQQKAISRHPEINNSKPGLARAGGTGMSQAELDALVGTLALIRRIYVSAEVTESGDLKIPQKEAPDVAKDMLMQIGKLERVIASSLESGS